MIHGDILGERARISPEKTALIYVLTQQRFTYRELNDRAVRCARLWLERCCLTKGDRVGILAKNRVEFLDAFFAAGKTGIILVPLNTRLTAAELDRAMLPHKVRPGRHSRQEPRGISGRFLRRGQDRNYFGPAQHTSYRRRA